MPVFTVVPVTQTTAAASIITLEPSRVLNIVAQLPSEEADVLRDGVYSYSIRLDENRIWSIFQKTGVDAQASLLSALVKQGKRRLYLAIDNEGAAA